MPMLLIKGTYRILGTQPDGDTLHFTPQDPGFWCDVPGRNRVARNSRGGGKLRLDGIDALETHYQGVGPDFVNQPLDDGAHSARDELLKWLGFTTVVQGEDEKVTASTPETVPGYVLAGGADTYGRCIAMAGRGPLPSGTKDGDRIDVDVNLVNQSANHHLLSRGLVYPTFYTNLPQELRLDMADTAKQARTSAVPGSVWAKDATRTGATVTGLSSITTDLVILPKLFRRLADYIRLFGPSLNCFPAYLAGEGEEFHVPEQEESVRGLQHIVTVTDNTVKLTRDIEDIVLVDK
ncbi:nuclease [Kitasatospora sp. NPDC057015]|uniref:nuclease n=1 Tax=Kitasatospora sp. NPDC057015 TaxID=3346001 RepID=UPI00362A8428